MFLAYVKLYQFSGEHLCASMLQLSAAHQEKETSLFILLYALYFYTLLSLVSALGDKHAFKRRYACFIAVV